MSQDSAEPNAVSEPLRENLIETAIRFLQNAKVQQSPLTQKREFLQRKGLTKEEIDMAIYRAGVVATTVQPAMFTGPALQSAGPMMPALMVPPHISFWTRLKDSLVATAILSSLLYAAYRFYKWYIVPWLFGEQGQAVSSIDQVLAELREGLSEVVTGLADLKIQTGQYYKQVETVLTTSEQRDRTSWSTTDNSTEVRDEIRSLKALLLNRKQFPSLPAGAPVVPPSWQLQPELSRSSIETPSDKQQVADITAVNGSTPAAADSLTQSGNDTDSLDDKTDKLTDNAVEITNTEQNAVNEFAQ